MSNKDNDRQLLRAILHHLAQPEPEQTWQKRFARRMENELRELGSTNEQESR